MCGRYYRRADKQRIAEAFRLGELPDGFILPPDFNVAPSTVQPVIRQNKETGDRELVMIRWELLPYFAKSPADFRAFSTIPAGWQRLAVYRDGGRIADAPDLKCRKAVWSVSARDFISTMLHRRERPHIEATLGGLPGLRIIRSISRRDTRALLRLVGRH